MKRNKHKGLAALLSLALICALALFPAAPAFAAAAQAHIASANTVERLAGQDRYETAARIAQAGWPGTADYAVLAAGMDDNLVDALTAAPLAEAKNAPILLTQGDSLNAFARSELQRLKVKTVYVTSGPGVIKQPVIDQVTALGISVEQLGGVDRFATAVNIAKKLAASQDFTRIIVATGFANADALSVASVAAAEGMPILLAGVDSLPGTTAAYIDSLKESITDTYVVGGSGAVSDTVLAALPHAQRAAGADRFATNVAVLQKFAQNLSYGHVFVANGLEDHLVDALAAAPLAARTASPMVLSAAAMPAATIAYVKSNLLPRTVTVLGGEAVVPAASLTAIASATEAAAAGAVLGSSDAANKSVLSDNLIISGANITVHNAIAPYGLYVSGDNATLANLQAAGTIFLDPGPSGSATLDNVSAAGIVVLSGGSNSIHLKDVTATSLMVDSSSPVRVESAGTTNVGTTYVASAAILDAAAGNLGLVDVVRALAPGATVELRGTFTQPVLVEGAATVKAAPGASIAQLTIAPHRSDAQVTLDGAFAAVKVDAQADVVLAAGATVAQMTANAAVNIQVPPGASIADLTNNAGNGALVSGGGLVNGQTTSTTPSVPPPSNGGTSGGGSGGNGGTQIAVSSITANTDSDANPVWTSVSGGNPAFDFTGVADSVKLTGLTVGSTPSAPTLVVTSIEARGMEWLNSSIQAVLTNGGVTTKDLLGNLDNGSPGISLGNLRLVFGSGTVTLQGHLSKTGYADSSALTVTITLGPSTSKTTVIQNQWMTISKTDAKEVTVVINAGQENVTLGELTSGSNGFNFVNAVAAVAIGNITSYNGASTAADLQEKIAASVFGYVFNDIPLGKLVGKTITFGSGNNAYTVIFSGQG